ncbi:hypothetical protein SISNIDRAFT_492355 [Sistotremastrum niveocremeum HHB9708]|uniref:Nitrogen permease regulator 3 n=1 Tax=Sistotremastrum niveocremeum HHB9708 TaxID=1314777 RepID=A0A165AIU0_9AGAM|nr:hypothetical protein SISNIDRAFT_492355 [Sistotremastrum niveocremeum HHB9708]
MAESLLAILLITSSAKDSQVTFRWPSHPQSSPRLARPRLIPRSLEEDADIIWRASHSSDQSSLPTSSLDELAGNEELDAEWERAGMRRARSVSYNGRRAASSRPGSGRNSPVEESPFADMEYRINPDYDVILGFPSKTLASVLLPHKLELFHEKFELTIDDLAFIGHPVCATPDRQWAFQDKEPSEVQPRGRNTKKRASEDETVGPTDTPTLKKDNKPPSQLDSFHLVFVMDLPDPSSASSGNIAKYFDLIYRHLAFSMTAMLFQEQVTHNFVERECDNLANLKEKCLREGEPYSFFVEQAQSTSSLAYSMKVLFEEIKSSSIANLTLGDLRFEVQVPPFIDTLLHPGMDLEDEYSDAGEGVGWGMESNLGWHLPSLMPWKALLLLDLENQDILEPLKTRGRLTMSDEDKDLAEDLDRFLQEVSISINLRDLGILLNWPMETHVYPIVRWLVKHRRAKLIDAVHPSLKTIFGLAPTFPAPLSDLSAAFDKEFDRKDVAPLPEILSALSSTETGSPNSNDHFYAMIVGSKERIPIYRDVMTWMLKRDLLVAMHLRVRIVATKELKMAVYNDAQYRRDMRSKKAEEAIKSSSDDDAALQAQNNYGGAYKATEAAGKKLLVRTGLITQSPVRRRSQSSGGSRRSQHKEVVKKDLTDEDDPEHGEDEIDELVLKEKGECLFSSVISDPARATPVQRRWIAAMSAKKDKTMAKLFQQINQYFDGKKTDDEILYRADITRKQLRFVLTHFGEYVQTFLYPS